MCAIKNTDPTQKGSVRLEDMKRPQGRAKIRGGSGKLVDLNTNLSGSRRRLRAT